MAAQLPKPQHVVPWKGTKYTTGCGPDLLCSRSTGSPSRTRRASRKRPSRRGHGRPFAINAATVCTQSRLLLTPADDGAAVEAGLSQEWSNGQTEGQVNKLKLLKRQMYGRYVIWNLAPRDGATGTRCLSLSRTGRVPSWKALQRRRSPRDGRSWLGIRMA